jgi:uncharacterized membrane protein
VTNPLRRHPAVVRVEKHRAANLELRVADAITRFCGSMMFIYIHVVGFGVWMLLVEKSPWPTLTLVVSLEAIFLATFVLISQNRQAAIQKAQADHDFVESEQELKTNTDLTRKIHELTQANAELADKIHGLAEEIHAVAIPKVITPP